MYDEMKTCECAPVEHRSNLTEILQESDCLAADVLKMACQIKNHLFGLDDPANEPKLAEPTCFKEQLIREKTVLLIAAEQLSRICSQLGV